MKQETSVDNETAGSSNRGGLPPAVFPAPPGTHVQRESDTSATGAPGSPGAGASPSGQERTSQTVDVEKIADMVYRMMRQDLIIESERLPRRG